MTVTNVTIVKLDPKNEGVCGEVTVTLDDELCIHKIHIIKGKGGLFIAFPNTGDTKRYSKAKRYVDLVHPTKNSLRQYIQAEVLKCYYDAVANSQ